MTASPEPRPRSELRASHEDREAVAEQLREAAGDGRLDLDELEERLERALTAKTYGELEPLTADLPAPAPPPAVPPLTIKGGVHGAERVGWWQVPERIVARGGLGGVKLDFTRAECAWREVTVDVHGDMGGVTLVVPDDWAVDATAVDPGLGGVKDKTASERRPHGPLLRLTGTGGMGGVTVRRLNRWERRRLRARSQG